MTWARDPDGPFSEPDPTGLPPAGAFNLEVERPLRSYLPVATNVTLCRQLRSPALRLNEILNPNTPRPFRHFPTTA